MDFTPTPEMVDAAALAAQIFGDHRTSEHLRSLDAREDRFDDGLWRSLGEAGLLGLGLPEAFGGAALGMLELGAVLTEQGRSLGAIPLATHVAAGLAVAKFAPTEVASVLWEAATGESLLTVIRDREPGTSDVWTAIPGGTRATVAVLADDLGLTFLRLDALDVEPQRTSTGDVVGRVQISEAVRASGVHLGGPDAAAWLNERLDALLSAYLLGVCEGALKLTSNYAKTREQFERPIATFQAVSQRLADGYIDTLGLRITLQQALWRLASDLPSAVEVATAALWATDNCHRIAHTTVHIHGGVGIDLDGEAHRYFTAAKVGEFSLGGTTRSALAVGRELASI